MPSKCYIEACPGNLINFDNAVVNTQSSPIYRDTTYRDTHACCEQQESIKTWAAACPMDTYADVEGGPRARAAAATKAGNPQAGFLALAYGEVTSRFSTALERFETRVSTEEVGRRTTAASERRAVVLAGPCGGRALERSATDLPSRPPLPPPPLPPPPPPPPALSRVAALRWTDIEGRRLLLHTDLSRTSDGGPERNRDGLQAGVAGGQEIFPESVQLVAEQVRGMLSAKPAVVAIVSELSPPTPASAASAEAVIPGQMPSPRAGMPQLLSKQTAAAPAVIGGEGGGSVDADIFFASPGAVLSSSLRSTAAAVSSLLGMEVEFYESVPEMAMALERCGQSGGGVADDAGSFGARLMMTERLSGPGVVPPPPVESPELSDAEEERLPDFGWGGEGKKLF